MRLIFQTRLDAFAHRGGDTIQMVMLADAIRALGHVVEIGIGVHIPPLRDVDLVHIFNLQRPGETAAQLRRVRSKVPVVISPIYGDTREMDTRGRTAMHRWLHRVGSEWLLELGKQALRVTRGVGEAESLWPLVTHSPQTLRRIVLTQCEAAYPNSQWEADGLRRQVRTGDLAPCHVVPNAVDPGLLHRGDSAARFRERWHVATERFVLCVARFDERKNNLRLMMAAQQAGLPCILIGHPAPLHQGLFARCQALAAESDSVRIIQADLRQEELVGAYRAAWVHALPSWLETPGLVNLEAGLCGANLVVGDCPSVREYLMDRAWYCDPGQVRSIAAALRQAIAAPRNARRLDEHIADQFTWSRVGALQLQLYGVAVARWQDRRSAAGGQT